MSNMHTGSVLVVLLSLLAGGAASARRGHSWVLRLANFVGWGLAVFVLGFILLGFICPCPVNHADRDRTMAFHRAIISGLEHYREKHGEYPVPVHHGDTLSEGSQTYPLDGARMLYQVLSGDGNDAIQGSAKQRFSDGKIEDIEIADIILQEMPREMIRETPSGFVVVDGFGHPFQYEAGQEGLINESYDLWSFGEARPVKATRKVKEDEVASARWIKNF